MSKKSSEVVLPRIPPSADGIQVNFCRKIGCTNFGIADDPYERPRKGRLPRGINTRGAHRYKIVGEGKNLPVIKCLTCGQSTRMKSNLGIAEELTRLSAYLQPNDGPSCPNGSCANHGLAHRLHAACYRRKGYTNGGALRLQCRTCGRTFSVPKPTRKHRKPHENRTVFSLLMNGVAIRRAAKIADITPSTLYGKIDFLHRQCVRFAGARERRLLDLRLDRLYLATDRQDYYTNWINRLRKQNVRLSAVGTADLDSGYVFALSVDYDPNLDQATVEDYTWQHGEAGLPAAFRRYARTWIAADLEEAKMRTAVVANVIDSGRQPLPEQITRTYDVADALEREEFIEQHRALPHRGAEIRREYTAAAHFHLLRWMLSRVGKLRFFLDQDADLRSGCFGAFPDRIQDRSCDVFYVRIAKELTVDEKRERVAEAKRRFEDAKVQHPDVRDEDLKLMLIAGRLAVMKQLGPWNDKWLEHPLPTMAEPDKAIAHLTDHGDLDLVHAARLFRKASLHAIDRFFMQVRRAISVVERPIQSPRTARRVWRGRAAYNPEVIVKLLEMFRVVFNYVEVGEDGRTPAMRLGLAEGRIRLEDIIYFDG